MPRPEGLAFDVKPGSDLTGVPAGDQIPRNPGAGHIQETVRETGESIGLAVPGRLGGRPAELSPEQASFRRPLNRLPGRQPRWRTSTSTAPPMSS